MAKTPKQDDLGVNVRIDGDAVAARVIITERCDPTSLSPQIVVALLRQQNVEVGKPLSNALRRL